MIKRTCGWLIDKILWNLTYLNIKSFSNFIFKRNHNYVIPNRIFFLLKEEEVVCISLKYFPVVLVILRIPKFQQYFSVDHVYLTSAEVHSRQQRANPSSLALSFAKVVNELSQKDTKCVGDTVYYHITHKRCKYHHPTVATVRRGWYIVIFAEWTTLIFRWNFIGTWSIRPR